MMLEKITRNCLFSVILMLLAMPASTACWIEFCYYGGMEDCDEIEEMFDDGEEIIIYTYFDCSSEPEQCEYEWDDSCGGGGNPGGGGSEASATLQVTISPDTNQLIILSQSVVYSSTATIGIGEGISTHDIDWKPPGETWVSGLGMYYDTSGPGSADWGALTGTVSRCITLPLVQSSVRSITLTPTQTGTYSVRFSSQNEYGKTKHSATHTMVVLEPPTPPSDLALSGITSNWATITWTASTAGAGIAGYKIILDSTMAGSTTTTAHTFTGLAPATAYAVTVKAMDAIGNISDPSAPFYFTTRIIGHTISDITATSVTLAWNGSIDSGMSYEIERSTDGINFSKIATVFSALSYTDINVDSGATYYYRIRASDGNGSNSSYTSMLVTTTPTPPQPPPDSNTPPQAGLRLWLRADSGVQTNVLNQVTKWLDQSASQKHAVLAPGGTGPQVNISGTLGFPAITFDGQTNALELPNFMAGATTAISYVIVKSETTSNPLWSMGDAPAGTLYPAGSGRIEDDFASTTTHITRDSNPPLHQWHAYQVTSLNGAWWSAIDQTLLPTIKSMTVQPFIWSDTSPPSVMSTLSVSYIAGSGTDSPLPALLPETGLIFDATVQAADPLLADNYFGLSSIALGLEGGPWLDSLPDSNGPFIKKTPFVSGTARLTLTLDEVEALLGSSLHDRQIAYINFVLESAVLDSSGAHANDSYFNNNYDIKTHFAIPGTEVKNIFNFAAFPEIGAGFKGEIAEILIYDQAAAADESANNYLHSKYGLFSAFDPLKDSDGDGIPDAWEIRNGLNPFDPTDALKTDANGATWLQKYRDETQAAGKSPWLGLEIFSPKK